jgi:hypothetical protein
MNYALLVGGIFFMLLEMFNTIREHIKHCKRKKSKKSAVHPITLENSTTQSNLSTTNQLTSQQNIISDTSLQNNTTHTEIVQDLENPHGLTFDLNSSFNHNIASSPAPRRQQSLNFRRMRDNSYQARIDTSHLALNGSDVTQQVLGPQRRIRRRRFKKEKKHSRIQNLAGLIY